MIRRMRAAALVTALALAGGCGLGPAGAEPATLSVRAAGRPAATLLHLQPGFATVLRADHRVDTVAIGDPRLVTATAVPRGQDAYDLVLQPQAETGTTNMVVWYGDLATVWTLEIGPGPRTADIVYVMTAGAGAKTTSAAPLPLPAGTRPGPEPSTTPSLPNAPPSSAPASSPKAAPLDAPAPPAAPATTAPDKPHGSSAAGQAGAAGPPLLEVHQSLGDVVGVFQVQRGPDDVLIRYRITNGTAADLTIRPGSVLVRVNGRLVPYGMARDSIDRGRPEILPRGATETGVIDAPSSTPRRVQVILSLFPVAATDEPGGGLPLTFQPVFTGVDRLAISAVP